MKRSKTQAVYRFLPDMWISEKDDSGRAISARIKNWNYIKMSDIYEDFIEEEIKRQIKLFGDRGGDITAFDITPGTHTFSVVETACNEGIPDIIGEMSPLVFYCSSCGKVFDVRNPSDVDKYTWKCKECGKMAVKQLQMIYACECGHAQPIKIPYVPGVKDFKYRPNETQYKMFYKSGLADKPAEFVQTCPTCNARLVPDNANSGRNYKPFTLRVINLVDERCGRFYKKGLEAQKTIVSRWFDKVSADDYEEILNNIDLAFSEAMRSDAQRIAIEQQVRSLVDAGLLSEEMFESAVNNMLQNTSNTKSVERYVTICDDLFAKKKAEDPAGYTEWLGHFSFKLMQYDTLKYAKRIVTLEEAIQRQLEMEFIDSADEVHELNAKLGIKNMQVSCDIQILNCTYGYTRRSADPKIASSNNPRCRLKLNAYDKTRDGTANLVYGAKLDTEGILFEIDQRKIIEWLYDNDIILEEQLPDLDDEVSVKKWFAEYVHSDVISMFGEIDESEIITKNVFALLHSMSHAFMNAAGELSGLSSNSLTEIIIVETASIFIYAQTSQGIPLGALSGMAETNYAYFLKKAFDEAKNCVFDPICTERDDTACSACLIIPEISCNHFNAELGRKYLYSIDGVETPTIGFWEM